MKKIYTLKEILKQKINPIFAAAGDVPWRGFWEGPPAAARQNCRTAAFNTPTNIPSPQRPAAAIFGLVEYYEKINFVYMKPAKLILFLVELALALALASACSPRMSMALVDSRERDIFFVNNLDSLSSRFVSASVNPVVPYDMRPWEVNVGIGGEALFACHEFALGIMDVEYPGPRTATELYKESYDTAISATVSVDWAYNLNYRWAITGSYGGNHVDTQFFNPCSGAQTARETAYMFYILAGARYRYRHTKSFSVYSQLQFGYSFHTPGEYWNRNEFSQGHFGWQITGLGVTYGSRLFGLAEFGWGSEYVAIGMIPGGRIGIGYKF